MKKITIIFSIAFLIVSCGEKQTELQKKKAELEKLKKELASLTTSIKKIEKEIYKIDPNQDKTKITDVGVSTIEPETFNSFIEVQGVIDSRQTVDVSPKMGGVVTKVLARLGQRVGAGQILAYTDNSTILKQIQTLKTQLAFAQVVFEKQKTLWSQNIGTEVQFLQTKNNVDMIQSQISTLNETLELSYIKAPINGTIDELNLKVGQAVTPGFSVAKIVNLGDLRIMADLAETHISKIRNGSSVEINLPDINYKTNLPITFVGSIINPMKRTFPVEIRIAKDANLFKPNMVAKLKINESVFKNVIVIPSNVIQNDGEEQYVLIAKEKNGKYTAEKKPITVSKVYDGKALIMEGLNMNELLIVNGYAEINEGDRINFTK